MLGMRRTASMAFLLALLATSGCGSDPSLQALEKDPTASFAVPGTHLEYESKHNGGTTLGKPVHAKITRQFALGDVPPEKAVATVSEFARAHGWTPEFSRAASFSAHKRIDGVRAELVATFDSGDGTPSLYVYLTAL